MFADVEDVVSGECQKCDLFFPFQALINVRLDFRSHHGCERIGKFGQFVQPMVIEPYVFQEALLGGWNHGVSVQPDVCVLVGFNVVQQDVGEIQDILIGAVVDVQLVGGKCAGTFQNVQRSGVGCPEFV